MFVDDVQFAKSQIRRGIKQVDIQDIPGTSDQNQAQGYRTIIYLYSLEYGNASTGM